MSGIFLSAAVIRLTMFSTYGQTQSPKPSNSACSLTVAKSPAIRGVKLGMKLEDVLAMFPGSTENKQIKARIEEADRFPNFGVVRISIRPAEYVTKDRFSGIYSYSFVALDGRITSYQVNYRSSPYGPTWHRVDDFIDKLGESLNLPPATAWAVHRNLSSQKILRCDGFQLEALILNSNGLLTVSTIDLPYKTQQQRREAFKEKLRREFKP